MKDLNKVLIAAGIGLIAGGIIGVLLAPEKGSDLRKKLSSKAKEFSEDILEDAKEGFASLKEKMAKEPVTLS